MRLIFLYCLCLWSVKGLAQQCDCAANFRYMVEKVEKNYVGFHDKVTPASKAAYRHLTDSLLARVDTASMHTCLLAMQQWIHFFKDRHMAITPAGNADNGQLALVFSLKKTEPAHQPQSVTPTFTVLDDHTCLLTIPSARLDFRSGIDSLIDEHRGLLNHITHLIIDVRNNRGGSVLCFEKLLPFIYTRPMISSGESVLATTDNIDNYYAVTDYPNISDSMKQVFTNEARQLREHVGTYYNLWPGDTLTFPGILPAPAKVSIIMNENSASSTELFLLNARQSSKVKLYGVNTMGAVDYTEVVTLKMPCSLLELRYASARSNRLPTHPLDNIGIDPDVRIPDTEKDWVSYVRTHRN